MSLYVLGKLVPASTPSDVISGLRDLGKRLGVGVGVDDVDEGDAEALASVAVLSSIGVHFSLYARPGETDATELWIAATKLGQASEVQLRQTLLAQFVEGLMALPCTVGGLALFDGAIEQTFQGRPDECRQRLLASLSKPWDQSENVLYVWTNSPKPP